MKRGRSPNNHHRRVRSPVTNQPTNRTTTTRYYISTGAKSNYYTLRYSFEEYVSEDSTVTRDYHICNLSINKDEAITKAQALGYDLNIDLNIDFDVLPIGTRRKIDWSILQGGKYAGQSIHEVRDIDAGYLVWLCENCATSRAYAETVELAKALVASELATRKDARDAIKIEREALVVAFAPIADIFDRTYPIHVQVGHHQWEYTGEGRNSFVDDVVATLRRGIQISYSAADILIDKVAKESGRRNSKAYRKAYDSLLEIVTPAIKP